MSGEDSLQDMVNGKHFLLQAFASSAQSVIKVLLLNFL